MRRSAIKKALVILMSLVLVFSSNSTMLTPVIAYAAELAEQSESNSGLTVTSEGSESDAVGENTSESEGTGEGINGSADAPSQDDVPSDSQDSAADDRSDTDNQDSTNVDELDEDDSKTDKKNDSTGETSDSNLLALAVEEGLEVQASDSETTVVTRDKYWIDNGSSARPDNGIDAGTKTSIEAMALYYRQAGSSDSWILLQAGFTLASLGMDSIPDILVTNEGTNHSIYKAEGLPTQATISGTIYNLEWKIDEKIDSDAANAANKVSNLSYARSENNGALYNTELKSASFYIEDLDGAANEAHANSTYTLYRQTSSGLEKVYKLGTDGSETSEAVEGTFVQAADKGSNYWAYTFENLPKYNSDNTEITYVLKCDNKVPEITTWDEYQAFDDWYAPTYDNSAVPNYGTETTQAYEGGTIQLLRTNTYKMTIHKTWLDDNNKNGERPGEDGNRTWQFYLWRYTNNGSNTYQNASQVVDDNGYAIGADMHSDNTGTTGLGFTDGDTEFWYTYINRDGKAAKTYLPKYDAQGYEYIYLVRETMPNNSAYEQVYGVVAEDGTVTDTNADGTTYTLDGGVRSDAADTSVYNGGTISNRLKGTTSVPGEKTWVAAAHQNYLSTYTVTMKLQQSADGGTTWTDAKVAGSTITETLSFTAETQTKDFSASVPLYDAMGRAVTYKWVEASLTENGITVVSKTDEDGSLTGTAGQTYFQTSQNTKENGDRQNIDWYTSTTESGDDGSIKVTNKLAGKRDYKVIKKWYNADGELKDPTDVTTLRVKLYQNGKPYSGADINEGTDEGEGWYSLSKGTNRVAEGQWEILFKNLPKYDNEGKLYDYYVMEEIPEGYYPTYSLDEESRTLTIDNRPGKGGKVISVAKEWIDDSNTAYRPAVTVKVSGTYENAGTGTYVDEGGNLHEGVTYNAGDSFTTYVTLDTRNNWWELVDVKDVADSSIAIQETKLGEFSVTYAEGETITGTVATNSTDGYQYEVTNGSRSASKIDGYWKYIVTNRRVGSVNIDVTKTWLDGNQAEESRPDAILTITSDEGHTIDKDSDGFYYVKLNDGTDIKATDENAKFYIKTAAGDNVTDSKLEIKKTSSSSYSFYGLPKFDLDGKIIHYTVSEKWADSAAEKLAKEGDYYISSTTTAYNVGETDHTPDTQEVSVTNGRSGSTTVSINKTWNDEYQYKLGNRPDIQLKLYQRVHVLGADGQVTTETSLYNGTGFKNYLWSPREGTNRAAYELTADFGTLPKYDSLGYEIDYFFEEIVPESAKTTYDYNEATYQDGNQQDIADITASEWIAEYNGTTLLKAGGTFVNSISNSVTFEGTKIWKNIPDGFPAEEVPKIKIWVNQTDGSGKKVEHIAETTELSYENATDGRLHFYIIQKGENTATSTDGSAVPEENKLPKYDSTGALYTYSLSETYTTGTTSEAGEWTNVFDTNDAVGSYTLENIYNGNETQQGKITVEKDWMGRDVEDTTYPVVTFTLYRQYKSSADGEYSSDSEQVATKTLNRNNSQYTAVFDNLPIYAPNGYTYRYYVVETAVNGETVTWKNSGVEGQSPYITLSGANAAQTVEASNAYVPSSFSVKANKVWTDGSDAAGMRPTEAPKLKITRYANAQSGQSNGIAQETIYDEANNITSSGVTVTWDPTTGDSWTFTAAGLERWAPNGMPWIYSIEEAETIEGYKETGKVSVSGADSRITDGGTLDLTSLSATSTHIENNFYVTATINKAWNDSNNAYVTRPASVRMKLQVAVMDSASAAVPGSASSEWTDISNLNNEKLKAYFIAKGYDDFWVSKWSDRLSNLPAMYKENGSVKYLYYRITEITSTEEVEGETLAYPFADSATHAYGDTATGTPWKSYTAGTTTTTASSDKKTFSSSMTNTLQTTSLELTKKWEDTNNIFGVRPSAVKFNLQYSTDGTTWTDYKDANGNKISTTVRNSDSTGVANTWAIKVSDLPKCAADGTVYQWRMSELAGSGAYTGSYDNDAESGAAYQTTYTNTLKTFSLTFDKQGEDTQQTSLNDVKVECYYGNNLLFTWTRDANGAASIEVADKYAAAGIVINGDGVISGLPAGTYTLKEKSAPEQYCQSEEMSFVIKNTGQIVSNSDGVTSEGNDADGYTNTIVMTDPLAKANFTINKKLKTTSGSTNLAGVTFQLYKYDGSAYVKVEGATATTDSKGQATFSDLYVGKYFVVETQVPDGVVYDYTTGYFFEVTNTNNGSVVSDTKTTGVKYTASVDGKDIETELTNGNLSVSNNAATIANKQFGASIVFKKTDADDGTALTGATFELWKKGYQESSYTKVATITDTNSDGIYEANKLERGTYQLVETKVPTGYSIDTPITGTDDEGVALQDNCVALFKVAVGTDGQIISIADGTELADTSLDALPAIKNNRILGTFSLTKKSDDGTAQSGVEFELQKQNGSSWESVGTYTTGEDGMLKVENLAWGTYRIRESKPAAGYVSGAYANWVSFTIAANSTTITRVFTNKMSDIWVSKVDEDSNALEGATFTLKDSAGDAVDSWTSADEAYELTGLVQDETYTLTEIQRPAGYYALSDSVTFHVNEKGEVELDSAPSEVSVDATNKMLVKVTNTYVTAGLTFTKTELVDESCADGSLNGDSADAEHTELLAGAMFTLSANDGKTADGKDFAAREATSDSDGKVTFETLPEGTYTLSETTVPEGHKAVPDCTIEVTGEGKVLMSSEGIEPFEVEADDELIDDVTDRQTLTFHKVSDVDGTTPIAGATYQLYRMGAVSDSGLSILAGLLGNSEGTLVAEATSDASGNVTFEGVLPTYKYRLHEKEAPAGSLRSAKDVTVYFQKDEATGKYKLAIDDDGEADVDGKAYYTAQLDENGNLVWYEPLTEYHFLKVDENGNPLAGASLQVEDMRGNIVESWTSTNEAYAIVGKLVVGETYRLVETAAPDGYELAAPIEFTVENNNGKVADTDSALPGRQHTVQISMVDTLTPATPSTPSNNGTTTPASKKAIPQTGDTTSYTPAIVMGVAGVALLVVGLVMGNRKK